MDEVVGLGVLLFMVWLFFKLLPQLWFLSLFVIALFILLAFQGFLQASGLDILIGVIVAVGEAWGFASRKARRR